MSHPAYTTDQRSNGLELAFAWILTVFTLGYFLPWAIAATRSKANSGAIGLVNFLAGWTVIGWIVALVMACGAHQIVSTVQSPPPPGWYPDPQQPGYQRYWDGQVWTEHQS